MMQAGSVLSLNHVRLFRIHIVYSIHSFNFRCGSYARQFHVDQALLIDIIFGDVQDQHRQSVRYMMSTAYVSYQICRPDNYYMLCYLDIAS